jgi:hypothetical protein
MLSGRLMGSKILRDRRQADKANNKHRKATRRGVALLQALNLSGPEPSSA